MALVYRTNGLWGTGKGAKLSASEVDNNFYDLFLEITALQENPPEPNNIAQFVVDGATFTVVMEDNTVLGPFDLPLAMFLWRDEWLAETAYSNLDLIQVSGKGLYFVLQAHVSDEEFDEEKTIEGLPVYQKIFGVVSFYDVGGYAAGAPGLGLVADSSMIQYVTPRAFRILANAPLSVAWLERPSTSFLTFPIFKGTGSGSGQTWELIGSIEFQPGENVGTFTFANEVEFAAGDRLYVSPMPAEAASEPSSEGVDVFVDATAADLSITFATLR